MTVEAVIKLGLQHHLAGRLPEAETLYRQALQVDPNHADALRFLGRIAVMRGQDADALDLLRRAVLSAPLVSDYQNDLAVIYRRLGRLEESIAVGRRAIELRPDNIEAYHNLGNCLSDRSKFEDALAVFRQALSIKPDSGESHRHLGNTLKRLGRRQEAVDALQQAVALLPQKAEIHNELAIALRNMGRTDEAIKSFAQAIQIRPDFYTAFSNLGNVLSEQGKLDRAMEMYSRAIAIKPDHAESHYNLGIALKDKGRLEDAIAAYRRALAIKPEYFEAYNNLGNALKDQGRLDEAMACYRQGVKINPAFTDADDNIVYCMAFLPSSNEQSTFAEGRRWNDQHAIPLRRFIQAHPNDRNPFRKLRVGYVSPDFRNHPVGRFMLSLLASHDRTAVDVFCYADVRAPDEVSAQFQTTGLTWRNSVRLSDEQLTDMIRRDQIDILVDLSLHMARNRLLAFARKPAPVQVTFAGYPGSTGMDAIDYRLTDPYLDPPGVNEGNYAEKTVRLPATFWCDHLMSTDPQVCPAPVQHNGYITFGSLNNFCKVNDQILAHWASVLRRVSGSHLLMLAPEGPVRQNAIDQFGRSGISADRLEFVSNQHRLRYLQTYQRIDIGLDTWPYNGHATSFDSFWMGVPVVTLVGSTVVGRAGLSQLTNLGLTELIGHTAEKFEEIAVNLAGDLPRLTELRSTLRSRMQKSPLMDATRFAQGIEAVYRSMWRTWCS